MSALEEATGRIAQHLETRVAGHVEHVSCEENSVGLFISLQGEQDERYLLHKLDSACETLTCADPLPDRSYSLGELLTLDLRSPPALIDGLLHERETLVIAGRQKVGKSRLTQQMALCLATGEPFLGMNVPSAAKVLMIDFENRLAPLRQRFLTMGSQPAANDRLRIWCATSLDSTLPDASTKGSSRLLALVEHSRPDVIIIDPWRLWLNGDENDAAAVVKGLKVLSTLRRSLPDLAIVIVHHVRKERFESPRKLLQDPSLWADAVSGHHALTSHVDACYGLERQMDEEENALIVFGGIARNVEPQTLILEEEESLRFSVAGSEDTALKVMTQRQREIWRNLTRDKFGFNEAVTMSNTKNSKAVSATLKIGMSHGLLLKQGDFYMRQGAKVRN